MPRVETDYKPINDIESVIEAQLIDPNDNNINVLPIINGETPQLERHNFISKVYSILWVQILLTSIFVGCCNQIEGLKHFMSSDTGTALLVPCVFIIVLLTCYMYCDNGRLSTCPFSCLYLGLFTGAITFMMGYVGVVYQATTLLLAGISTLGIFSGLTIYAIQTKYDYTDKGGYLISFLLGLIIFSIFVPFTNYSTLSILYSSLGSLIFSFYIVYDTQLIIGGNHRKLKFRTNDYVVAAMSLYLDLINLFLMILDLLNGGRN